jgi:hypothetical protein
MNESGHKSEQKARGKTTRCCCVRGRIKVHARRRVSKNSAMKFYAQTWPPRTLTAFVRVYVERRAAMCMFIRAPGMRGQRSPTRAGLIFWRAF